MPVFRVFVMEAMLSQNGWLAGIWALTRRAEFVRPISLASGRTSSALRFATCSVEPNSFGHNADRSGLASAIAAVFRYPSPPLRYPLPLLRFSMLHSIEQNWFANIRGDVLSGLVVALALIPEAIAFSIIAGVDPRVGLYASFCIAVVIAFVGGRPGMISPATGAMALLMVTLVREHGLQHLLAATLLCGVLQIGAGYLRLGSLMRFVSRSVVTGFVNALAILIFMAQLPELTDVTWHVYAMTAAGLGIIYLFPYVPKIGRVIPSPLVCILSMTAVAVY